MLDWLQLERILSDYLGVFKEWAEAGDDALPRIFIQNWLGSDGKECSSLLRQTMSEFMHRIHGNLVLMRAKHLQDPNPKFNVWNTLVLLQQLDPAFGDKTTEGN